MLCLQVATNSMEIFCGSLYFLDSEIFQTFIPTSFESSGKQFSDASLKSYNME